MLRSAYPAVRRSLAKYALHGVEIAEPYDWLEDADSSETKSFVEAQNKLFEETMAPLPHRQACLAAITKMQDYPRCGALSKRGDYFYFYHNTGMQNQSVLKRTRAIAEADEAAVFLDPNLLSEAGTSSLRSTGWSKSDRYFGFCVSDKGSDWCHIKVRDAVTGEDLPDRCDWVKASGLAWIGDVGFLYTRFPELDASVDKGTETGLSLNGAVYFHRLGDSQSNDVRIFDQPEHPTWLVSAETSDCHQFVVFYVHDGCEPNNLIYVSRVNATDGSGLAPKPLVTQWEAEYNYLSNDGTKMYFQTTLDAPLKRVIAIDVDSALNAPAEPPRTIEQVVAATDAKLDFCAVVGDTLLLTYLKDVKHVMYKRALKDTVAPLVSLNIPIGTVIALSARRDCPFVAYKMTSFLLPGRSFYFDINTTEDVKVFRDDTIKGFDPDLFETKQIFYDAPDGVKIPMFIFHRRGLELTGNHPTVLYGYGGFNISITPSFSASRIVFLQNFNGVFAVANIRGGGEYGEDWHKAGCRNTKITCFTDFIAGAEYLHAAKFCSPKTLAIVGGSNGGLLVAACANRAPHLFSAVVCQVGVLDIFKFHKFTIGHAWKSDFGDPEDATDFAYQQQYSPLHNIKSGVTYPAILCATGDHDDRVVPLHSFKYTAEMQHANPTLGGPFLARIEVNVGHGAGKPTSKIVAEAADTYCFIGMATGAQWHD